MRSLRIIAATAGVLALAACGSSETQSGSAPATADTTVAVGNSNALTDANGRTLYFTDQDSTSKLACVSNACMRFWTPLTVTGDQAPTGPDQVSGKLSTTKRPEGTMQVTYDGKPLYTFSLDKTAGQVNGNGLTDEFDGTSFTWHAITTEGAAPATTQPNNDDPGYGY